MGIEADLILFHPYDNWGFSELDHETDVRYLRYVIARLSSFRNIWWSLANEWDMCKAKTIADWDDFFSLLQTYDPVGHLRSIHQFMFSYDHTKKWVTHVSFQGSDFNQMKQMIGQYKKPVVFDECGYEGNIPLAWGNLSGREMVHRIWDGFSRGGYVGHGEVYENPEELLWWSKGGKSTGDSPERLCFLRQVLEEMPGIPQHEEYTLGISYSCLSVEQDYYLFYLGCSQPCRIQLDLPACSQYRVEILDTWACTITEISELFSGSCSIPMPGKPYLAVRITKMQNLPESTAAD